MRKLNVFGYGYLPFSLKNSITNIRQFFRNIKYAWQRATRGYCNQDLWNMDYFYSQLFVDSMKDFTKNLHGAPMEFYDESNDSIEPWTDYINEIAQHFYNSIEDNEVQKNEYTLPETWTINETTGHIEQRALSDEEQAQSDKWIKREREIAAWREMEMKAGFEMLSKVFFMLWD